MTRIDSDPATHGRVVITITDRANVNEQVLLSRVDEDVVVAADVCRLCLTCCRSCSPCEGVRVVADVLIGMWIPRTLIIKRSSRLDLHGRNDSGRMDGWKEDAGRVGYGRKMVEALGRDDKVRSS
jgi:hypothetical protein